MSSISGFLFVGAVLFQEIAYTVPQHQQNEFASCSSKFSRIPGHSACRDKSPLVTRSGITVTEKLQIVQKHNELRQQVSPTASNMLKMEWDDELAMVAQKYADTCARDHESNVIQRAIPGRYNSVGQNLAWGFAHFDTAIQAWFDEREHFTYGTAAANVLTKIGHYTQVVWADSKLVGCGFSICKGIRYHFCNYAPAGNRLDVSKPYTAGIPGSACPGHAAGKLCDCHACENNSKRDLTTCQCACVGKHYSGEMCEKLSCNASDSAPCTRIFKVEDCTKFPQVPSLCPWMCSICPGITENSVSPVTRRKPTISTISSNSVTSATGKVSPQWTMLILLFLPFTILY